MISAEPRNKEFSPFLEEFNQQVEKLGLEALVKNTFASINAHHAIHLFESGIFTIFVLCLLIYEKLKPKKQEISQLANPNNKD